MRQFSSDIAFTPTVKNIQTDKGSRVSYARMEWPRNSASCWMVPAQP